MRAVAGILLVLALAPPASAETVARRTPAAGPALAGDALTYTATTIVEESDSVTDAYALAAVGGPLAGPGVVLGGSIPPRVVPSCRASYENVEGVDVDGTRIAVATSAGACPSDSPPQLSIALHDGAGRRDVPVPGGTQIATVRLAGDYLLWVQRDRSAYDELVLYDLTCSTEVRRVRLRDLGAREGRDAALQADGTVAFTFARRRGSRLAWFTAADQRLRVINLRGWAGGIALAHGRVLYERALPARFASEIVLRRLAGGKPRRLARYGARRGRVGTLDLDRTRATWAVEPTRRSDDQPTGRAGRIVLRTL